MFIIYALWGAGRMSPCMRARAGGYLHLCFCAASPAGDAAAVDAVWRPAAADGRRSHGLSSSSREGAATAADAQHHQDNDTQLVVVAVGFGEGAAASS